MTNEEIVKALRCTSTLGDKEQHCESCPFYTKEQLDPETAEKVGTDEWCSCDCDAVGLAAADRLEELLERCARYAEEIAVLRERQRWIPVTERLPEADVSVLTRDRFGNVRNRQLRCFSGEQQPLFRPDGLSPVKDILYWMPLPEVPEVE